MGAWGTGNFENDEALDWLAKLSTWDDVRHALDTPVPAGPSSAHRSCIALCAAEIVAASLGRPSPSLPEEARDWLRSHAGERPPGLEGTAFGAASRIERDSELQQLFDDGERDHEWHDVVLDLVERLRRRP